MKNPFRRKVIHVAIVNNTDGEDVTTLCGKVRKRSPLDVTGKTIRACGSCFEASLKEYPADEINDLLARMHDSALIVNRLVHPLNQLADLQSDLVDVLNRDGAAATAFKIKK